MARRDHLSPLGGMGELGIRRAALYFLSASVVDGWRCARFDCAVANRARSVHLAGAGVGGNFDVAFRARMALAPRCDLGCSAVRGESIPPAHRLFPQRFRGTAGQRTVSAGVVRRVAAPARSRRLARLALLALPFAAVWLSNAPAARAGDLFVRAGVHCGGCVPAQRAAFVERRTWNGRRIRSRGFLHLAGCLGTALGANSSGYGGYVAPRAEFSFHTRRRSGISFFQLESFGEWRWGSPGGCDCGGFCRAASPGIAGTLVDASCSRRRRDISHVPGER